MTRTRLKFAAPLLAAGLLAACGTTTTERASTGAIGGALAGGLIGGNLAGAAVGGLAGAGIGAATTGHSHDSDRDYCRDHPCN